MPQQARWTPDAIVLAIQEWAARHGRPPKTLDCEYDATLPRFPVVQQYFRTMAQARAAAGFSPGATWPRTATSRTSGLRTTRLPAPDGA